MSPGRRWLWLLLGCALCARLVVCGRFPQALPGGAVADIDQYHSLARGLLARWSFVDEKGRRTALREPGYPIVLAGLYALAGPRYRAVCLFHALLGALSVWGVLLLGARVFGPLAGWAAAWMAAFHPQLLYYTALPRRETFQVFLMVWGTWLLLRVLQSPEPRRVCAAAFVWACHALTNSVFFPAGLVAGACLWRMGRARGTDLRRPAGLFLAVFLGVFSLWPLRNAVVFKRFIPGIHSGGNHVYIGIIVPDDVAGTPAERDYVGKDPVALAAGLLPEDERDALFYRAAADYVRRHPFLFMRRMLSSGVKLWRPCPYARDYGVNFQWIRWASLLSDGWILPLALLGLLLSWRRVPETILFNGVVFCVTLTYMVFWAVIRYRMPLMPFVFLYAGHAFEWAARRAGLLRSVGRPRR